MSKLSDRVSYLKGLADGMKLNPDSDANKLLVELLNLMGEMTEQLDQVDEAVTELSDYVESIDDDLADLEEALFEDEDDEDDEEDDEDEDEIITYACPHCGCELTFRASEVDFDEDYLCPACGKSVFPVLEDEDDDPDQD